MRIPAAWRRKRVALPVLCALACALYASAFGHFRGSAGLGRAGFATQEAHPPKDRSLADGLDLSPVLEVSRKPMRAGGLQPEASPQTPEAQIDEESWLQFTRHYQQRFDALGSKPCSFLANRVPEDFRALFPGECAELEGRDEPLRDVIPQPSEDEIRDLFRIPLVRETRARSEWLYQLSEGIDDFVRVELESSRGQRAPISILESMAPFRDEVELRFSRADELWRLVDEFGDDVIAETAHRPPEDPNWRRASEERIAALLWEERCSMENQMLARIPREMSFWFYLSRAVTRYVYDDSYWLAPDELIAAERDYPCHIH